MLLAGIKRSFYHLSPYLPICRSVCLVCLFPPLCVCVCVCVCVCAYAAKNQHHASSWLIPHLNFWGKLLLNSVSLIWLGCQSMIFKNPPICESQCAFSHVCLSCLVFSIDAVNLNSGHFTLWASSPSPWFLFCFWISVLPKKLLNSWTQTVLQPQLPE